MFYFLLYFDFVGLLAFIRFLCIVGEHSCECVLDTVLLQISSLFGWEGLFMLFCLLGWVSVVM